MSAHLPLPFNSDASDVQSYAFFIMTVVGRTGWMMVATVNMLAQYIYYYHIKQNHHRDKDILMIL